MRLSAVGLIVTFGIGLLLAPLVVAAQGVAAQAGWMPPMPLPVFDDSGQLLLTRPTPHPTPCRPDHRILTVADADLRSGSAAADARCLRFL